MEAAKVEEAKTKEDRARLELVSLYVDEDRPEVREGEWKVEELSSADWALGRLGELEREIEVNESIAAQRIAEIEARTARLNARAKKGVDFFRAQLEAYAATHRTELLGTGSRKTRGLPNGSIGFRKSGGDLKTVDREALLTWAREQPVELELVRMKEEPCLNEIKKLAKEKSFVPPGMEKEPEGETIEVRTTPKEVR
jgi:phage host-nuclease inhibitor protein Gam